MKHILITAGFLAAFAIPPALADQIEGNWKTEAGSKASITKCAAFCVKLTSGQHSGKRIGKLEAKNGKYVGTITDPADDKTYSGNAKINGSTLKMQGCVAKIFCKTQNWSRL